jgi:TRAP-type C4-dicarboxylate transport system substrate-binding protein
MLGLALLKNRRGSCAPLPQSVSRERPAAYHFGEAPVTISRRKFLVATGATAAGSVVRCVQPAAAAEVTLKLHHFLPAVSNPHAKFLTPWAKKIEAQSGGRIKIDIYPAMQLGGTPAQLFDQAKDGIADIVWTLPGNTPGRFPSTEVFELPFVPSRKSLTNSKACMEYAETHLLDETKDVKLLCFWAHDHGLIHSNRRIRTRADLKGLKLRFPTRLAGEALKALGAAAIGMPIPQVAESLAQRVIDGCVVPWEVVPAIKVHELLKYHTEIPGSPTLYTATFFLAMNKARYEGLPTDLKKVIDDNSGMVAAQMAGTVWDEMGLPVLEMVKKRGNLVTTISEDEKKRWQQATTPVVDNWIKEMKDRNLDGAKLLDAARAVLAKYE